MWRAVYFERAARLSPTAALPLDLVLRLCLLGRLPLYVTRRVRAAARERLHVIYHVPAPAVRMPGLAHEVLLRLLATLNPAAAVAYADTLVIGQVGHGLSRWNRSSWQARPGT